MRALGPDESCAAQRWPLALEQPVKIVPQPNSCRTGNRRSRLHGAEGPPVVPPQMWQRLQAKLDLKAIPKGMAPEPTALLTGILHCAKCGRAMSRLKTGQGEFYYCRSGQDGCKNMIRLEIADGILSDSILSFGHVEYFE